MFELVSGECRKLERRLRDDSGAAGTEWTVAAAIVILFSIPVLTLLNSGTTSTTEQVAEAIENRDDQTLAGNAYSPEGDDDDEGDVDDRTLSRAEQNAAPAVPGLDKGVGFEISEAESKRGYEADPLGLGGTKRSSGNASPRGSGGLGGSGQANANSPRIENGIRSSGQPRAIYVGPRRDKPEVRQTEVARLAEEKQRQVQEKATQRSGVSGATVTEEGGVAEENIENSDVATCETHTRPKFIERRHEYELGAGLDEELFTDGGSIVEDKRRELFSSDEISFEGEENATVTVDCAENRALVTAAGEQLGDGTILGMVTISASSDEAPTRRAAPLGLGSRLSNAIGTQETETETSVLERLGAATVETDDSGIKFEAYASVRPTFQDIKPVFEITFDFEANSLAGRRAEASFAGEVEFVPVKSTVIKRSGR